MIDGRFLLRRRLGTGSTAVGLLVNDLTVGETSQESERVLKVAIDTSAATRLADEAKVLSGLRNPRLVHLVEGPVEVGGRQALVLESAGDQTLGEVLRDRERLSLDLLERWGTDLLEALVALDRAGVDHRDIKPANLGVKEIREKREDRAKHLVLFDFSLSSAAGTAVTAGTPPYLDPFLDNPLRGRYDSAAERYSASVVLFEMATGSMPRFGDGLSDPRSIQDEAAVEPGMFDPAVARSLDGFFRKALARDAKQRHDTATEMLAAWEAAFHLVTKTVPDGAEELAAQASPSTPLNQAGLSARALSALEPLTVSFDNQQLGTEGFRWAIARLPTGKQSAATRLADWAVTLEKEGVVRLEWVRHQKLGVLQKLALPLDNPRDRNCLAIFTCDTQSVYLQLWHSLFQKYAPGSIENVETILGVPIGKGTKYRHIPEELLDVLADAYREAAIR